MSLKRSAAVLLVAGLIAAPVAGAQEDRASTQDREFLAAAPAANQFEVTTGALARQKGRSAHVRRLGRTLVRDHGDQLTKLRTLAERLGVGISTGPTPRQARIIQRLQRLSGRSFDRAFLRAQASAHREAIALYLSEATSAGGSDALRELATRTLPVLGMHAGQVRVLRRLD
jgi:putative membrane protein